MPGGTLAVDLLRTFSVPSQDDDNTPGIPEKGQDGAVGLCGIHLLTDLSGYVHALNNMAGSMRIDMPLSAFENVRYFSLSLLNLRPYVFFLVYAKWDEFFSSRWKTPSSRSSSRISRCPMA
jgi:hypothetical protein